MSRKLEVLDNLIHVNRYSGNLLIKSESVSDHVWCMNSLAFEYIPIINEKFDTKFDLSKIIYYISLHDLDESLYCDIPRNFKYHNVELKSAIDNTVDQLMREYLPECILSDLNKACDKSTTLGIIIKLLDVAQAGFKMCSEIKLGNSYFKSQLSNIYDCIYGLQNTAKDVCSDPKELDAINWLSKEFLNSIMSSN